MVMTLYQEDKNHVIVL